VANSSNLTTYSSTAPSFIDWECHDHDEVSTGRRVATATVESGVPKHFSSDVGVSHSDGPIWTESNATSEKGLGLSLNCCKHGVLCSTRCEPMKLLLSGVPQQISISRLGINDVPSTVNRKDSIIPSVVTTSASVCVPESDIFRFKPVIVEETQVPDGDADPLTSPSHSFTHDVNHVGMANDCYVNSNVPFVSSSPALDYMPLIENVDVKPTLTNELHVYYPEPIMYRGMKIIGDSGAGETMLPYPQMFLDITVPRNQLEIVLADGTPVSVDGIGVTLFSKTTWYVRALSLGILSMSAYDDTHCTTHFHDEKMEIISDNGITFLTGTRCNDNLFYLDAHHLENAITVETYTFYMYLLYY
jgi:hypothetical protein